MKAEQDAGQTAPRGDSAAPRLSWIRSLLDGFASLVDLHPRIERPKGDAQSDEDALMGDWQAVGDDLRKAIGRELGHNGP